MSTVISVDFQPAPETAGKSVSLSATAGFLKSVASVPEPSGPHIFTAK